MKVNAPARNECNTCRSRWDEMPSFSSENFMQRWFLFKKIISQSFHEIESSLLVADLAGCQKNSDKIPGSKFPKRLIRARLVLTERLENLLFRKSLKIWGLERQLQLLLEISLFLRSVLINRSVEIPTLTDSCSIFFRFLKLGRNFFRSFFHEEVRQFFFPVAEILWRRNFCGGAGVTQKWLARDLHRKNNTT